MAQLSDAVQTEESDNPAHHPSQFLSRQSRRAFLASLGAVTALGTNMIGFLRDPQEAKAQMTQVSRYPARLSCCSAEKRVFARSLLNVDQDWS